MKKLILTAAAILGLYASEVKAQAFEQGAIYTSAGYGLQLFSGKTILGGYSSAADFKLSSIGPVYGKVEYAISDNIGIGLNIGYSGASAKWTDQTMDINGNTVNYNYLVKFNKLNITPRLNYHFSDNDIFDPYVGLGLGYKTGGVRFTTNDPNFNSSSIVYKVIPISLEMTAGCRFMFNEMIGGYVEAGIGHGYLQGGLVYKIFQ